MPVNKSYDGREAVPNVLVQSYVISMISVKSCPFGVSV